MSAVYIGSGNATVNLVLDISGYFTASGGAQYNTLDPVRIMDSRSGTGLSGPFTANNARTLQVTGLGGVPAGAVAITANLTVTNQTFGGFAAVGLLEPQLPDARQPRQWGDGSPRPGWNPGSHLRGPGRPDDQPAVGRDWLLHGHRIVGSERVRHLPRASPKHTALNMTVPWGRDRGIAASPTGF